MNKIIFLGLVATFVTGCNSTMEMPQDLASQPSIPVTTEGGVLASGFYKGNFNIADLYTGRFHRSAEGTSVFDDTYKSKTGGLTLTINKKGATEPWLLECKGSTSLTLGVFESGKPYSCVISQSNKQIGTFSLNPQENTSLVSFSMVEKDTGYISINDKRFDIESVNRIDGSMIDSEKPVGFIIKDNARTIAAINTNGAMAITLQSNLPEFDKDVAAIGALTAGFSWRPSNNED
ncbi:hypothetical protein [Vibrio sp. 10N.261.51.F12]|uniref:hypothetical protein n=1 Tax=Vibrio sp. 10N.261.51.F12 TaxID=3229679 RepID=UPI00354C5B10